MPTPSSRASAVCALCIGTAATFFLTGVTPLPVLLYFPISRRFGFEPRPELSMDYYGRSLLALLFGLALALCTYAFLHLTAGRRGSNPTGPTGPRPQLLLLLTAYSATALLLAAGLFAYQLSGRVLTAEPVVPNPAAPAPPSPASSASTDVQTPS